MGAVSGFQVVRGSRGDSNLLHLPLADSASFLVTMILTVVNMG